jgi:KaiC/GvpD/RAD55 family RecA-like ATPase
MNTPFNAPLNKRKAIVTTGVESLGDLLDRKIEPLNYIFGWLINEESYGLMPGHRGTGKTWLSLTIAYAVSAGKEMEPWGKGAGVKTVYLDGEMAESKLQERLKMITRRDPHETSRNRGAENLQIICRNSAENIEVLKDLDTYEGQSLISERLPLDTKLVIIDNLAAWCPSLLKGKEMNDSLYKWIKQLQKRGIAVLVVHHTNKAGGSYGSIIKEFAADYVLSLHPRKDSRKGKLLFTISHDKLRNAEPPDESDCLFSFTVDGEDDETKAIVKHLPSEITDDPRVAEVARLKAEGMLQKDIAIQLGLSISKVSRLANKIQGATVEADEKSTNDV